ncbi:phage tail tube protein [Chachezhania antarctica]|uniref:phage tail tube protein n=1 Tax=Chachezhania antarctica TaxID=2340860 RepID=UPI000EB41801|nr:phage tail tube protein [Chachezhania antarctica]
MSDADIGYGAKFGIEDPGTPGTYIDTANVTRIKPSGYTRDEEDATHLQSPDMMKEFIPALMEATPVEIDINWVPVAPDPFVTEIEAGGGNYQITAPNGVRMQFPGFFLIYEPGDLTNGKMTATVTVRPTGKPTLLGAV